MSLLLYDIKKGRKLTIIYVSVIFGVCALILGFLAYWHHNLNPVRDQIADDGLPKVALSLYVPATYETFECIADGPSSCGDFDEYTDSLAASPVPFTYTSHDKSDPGSDNGDGTRTVTLGGSLSTEDWVALGNAVTQDGSLAGSQIDSDAVTLDGSVASVDVPSADGAGASENARITFEFEGQTDDPDSVRVTSIVYGQGAGAQ